MSSRLWGLNRFALLVFALALAFAASQPALAQLSGNVAVVAAAAADQIVGAVMAAPTAPPRLDDPQARKLFDLALPGAATGDAPAHVEEFARQIEVSAAAGRIARAYLLAGIGKRGSGLDASQREMARRNFLTYLPELARIYDFRLLACARLADGATQFLVSAPQGASEQPGIRTGLVAIEAEISKVLAASISFVADRNIEERYRMARMQLLTGNAHRFSRFLDIKQSESIADQALAAAISERDSALAVHLKEFALAILR